MTDIKVEKAYVAETSDEDPIESGEVSFSEDVEIDTDNVEIEVEDND